LVETSIAEDLGRIRPEERRKSALPKLHGALLKHEQD